MKPGDLVRVKRGQWQKCVVGLVLDIYVADGLDGDWREPGEALVQPCDASTVHGRLLWAHPLDIEVISESR